MRLEVPEQLPIAEHVEAITTALREHQVVIVAGETGSGKTTQLPKICLELGRGAAGHDRPHPAAADRRAHHRRRGSPRSCGVELGAEVGYQVRFTDRSASDDAGQGDDRRHPAGRDPARPGRCAATTRSSSTRPTSAASTSTSCSATSSSCCRAAPTCKVIITSATIDTAALRRALRRRPDHRGHRPHLPGRDPLPAARRPRTMATADDQVDRPSATPCSRPDRRGTGRRAGVPLRRARDPRRGRRPAPAAGPADTEVLPLYARLSRPSSTASSPPHGGRRVVLATNVAETSLTVPGIRYVVDAGTARISRYSQRLKVQRLPIEAISQASANQRAGRCGRVARRHLRSGSTARTTSRPGPSSPSRRSCAPTSPRSSCRWPRSASATSPPSRSSTRRTAARSATASQLLEELGALHARRRARPRLDPARPAAGPAAARPAPGPHGARGRRAAAASREVMVIAAALTIQDPRERPADAAGQADAAHARFVDRGLDFLTLLNLWDHLARAAAGSCRPASSAGCAAAST